MYSIKIVKFKDEEQNIRDIRDEVFIKEQGFLYDIEYDGKDEWAIHSLVFYNNKVVGTGRMLEDGKIGRVAILKKYRNKGFGRKIVETFMDEAFRQSYKRVYLGAQVQAISFYEKLGFKSCSEEFYEGNIPHIQMQKIF